MENIYFYYGEESLIISNKINRLIRETGVDEYHLNVYDLDEENINTVLQDAITMPFLNPRKVVVCKNPRFLASDGSLTAQELESFNKYLSSPSQFTYFIIDANNIKLDDRKAIVKKLKSLPNAIETKELSDIEISGWIKRQCTINDVEISDDAIKAFYNKTGKDLINSKNEIDKLIAYAGFGGIITTDMVNKVVVKEIQKDVFSLSNAIVDKNKQKIINIYQDLINSGYDTYYLFALVGKSLRDIFFVSTMINEGLKQADIAKELKISPGRAYYLMRNAKSLDLNTVKEYIRKIGNLDYQVKSGQVDIKAGFELFLFGL